MIHKLKNKKERKKKKIIKDNLKKFKVIFYYNYLKNKYKYKYNYLFIY